MTKLASIPSQGRITASDDVPPPIAGGAPKPGERLLSDTQYMDSRTAETVSSWVESWRNMPQEQFAQLAEQL